MTVTGCALTAVGASRETNQDAVVAGASVLAGPHVLAEFDYHEGRYFFAVADGIGGMPAGDVASKSVAASLARSRPSNVGETIAAIDLAHDELYERVDRDGTLCGMGTTLAGIAVCDDEIVCFSVGDSFVGERVGVTIRPIFERFDEIAATRTIDDALGAFPQRRNRKPRSERLPLVPRRFVICTDGVLIDFPPDRIAYELAEKRDDIASARAFADFVATGPQRDNYSFIFLTIDPLG